MIIENGALLMQEGDVIDYTIDPNLSGAGWREVTDGPLEAKYVTLTGFALGDSTVVKAKVGATLTAKIINLPGADPYTPEEIAYKESFLYVVNSSGEKIPLGQFTILVNNDPIPL